MDASVVQSAANFITVSEIANTQSVAASARPVRMSGRKSSAVANRRSVTASLL